MKKILLFIFCFGKLEAQTNFNSTIIPSFNTDKIFPVQPERAALNKFQETQVSKFTGIANIVIPIYNIVSSKISIPISLTYNSSGIRVNEIATKIGLGWNITNCGEISRSKKGNWTDDNSGGFIFTNNKVNSVSLRTAKIQKYDTEPYEFNLSLPNGKSIKFFFAQDLADNKLNIRAFPLTDVKITPIYSGYKIISWIIHDTDGTQYEYGNDNVEKIANVRMYSFDANSLPAPIFNTDDNYYINSWKLNSIKSNNVITTFSYLRENYNYQNSCIYQGESSSFSFLDNNWGQAIQKTLFGTQGYTMVLKEINTPIETIKFEQDNINRQDLLHSKSLKNIKIYDKFSNQLKKQFEFEYDYFISSPDYVFNSYGCGAAINVDEISKRLYLKKITEKSIDNMQSINHEFRYYDDLLLPHRNSYAQDYWGYYNGEVNNSKLMPSYTITKDDVNFIIPNPDINMKKSSVLVEGSKRNINPLYTKACMLKSITYPTKGTTEFLYENNRTSTNDSIKKTLIDFHNLQQLHFDNYESLDTFTVENSQFYKIIKNFTLEPTFSDVIGIKYNSSASDCILDTEIPNIDCWKFNIVNILTNEKIFPINKAVGYGGRISNIGNYPNYIPAGNYRIELYLDKHLWDNIPEDNKPMINIDIEWSTYEDVNFSYFGGMRIKEIKNYSKTNELSTQKKYYYLDNNNKECGQYLTMPIFKKRTFGKFIKYSFPFCTSSLFTKYEEEVGFISLTATPVIPLQSISGNYMAYPIVKEEYVDFFNSNNNLKSTEEFSFYVPTLDFADASYGEEWRRGLSISKSTSNNVQKKFYNGTTQDIINGIEINNINHFTKYYEPCAAGNPHTWFLGDQKEFENHFYHLITNNKNNIVTTENTLDGINVKNNFEYTGISQISKQTSLSSIGEDVVTKYYYPNNLVNPSQAIFDAMENQNMIASPIKTETIRNGQQLSEQITTYDNNASTNYLILPKFIEVKKGNGVLEKKITYHQYDDKGNIQQYTPENGIPVSILWGYNKTLPIAKIENASYAQVQQYEANIQSLSNGTNEGVLIQALNNLRTQFPNAMVTTYTHKPLIGVSTITDQKGDTITYTYDSFGRLQYVTDKNGNKLSENQYNYKP